MLRWGESRNFFYNSLAELFKIFFCNWDQIVYLVFFKTLKLWNIIIHCSIKYHIHSENSIDRVNALLEIQFGTLPHISLNCWIFALSSNFCNRIFSASFSSSVSGAFAACCCAFKASRSAIFSSNLFLGFVLVGFGSSLVDFLLSSSESLLSQASLMSSSSSSPSHLSFGWAFSGWNPSASKNQKRVG